MSDEEKADGSARVDIRFGGEVRTFRLGLDEIRLLQKKTGFGVQRLFERNVGGDWFIDELIQTIKLGLEGGGIDPVEAELVIRRYCKPPYVESLKVAAQILFAVMQPVDGDALGKAKAGKTTEANRTPTAASPSPPSTAPAQ